MASETGAGASSTGATVSPVAFDFFFLDADLDSDLGAVFWGAAIMGIFLVNVGDATAEEIRQGWT